MTAGVFLIRSLTSQNFLFNKAGINFKAVPGMLTLLQLNSPTSHEAVAELKAALPPRKNKLLCQKQAYCYSRYGDSDAG